MSIYSFPWARQLRTPSPSTWTLALLLLALLAHAPALPTLAWPALALALASRALRPGRAAATLRIAGLALAYLACALLWGWMAAITLRTALLLVLALKWSESRRGLEFGLVGCAATVAVAIGSLQWGQGAAVALGGAAALLLVCLHAGAPGADTGAAPRSRAGAWARALAQAARQLGTALPLAAVLFVFFPRIPGPLWDIGLSFGLPMPVSLEKSAQGLGVSATLQPGQTQTGASEGQPVLVAEFRQWVPPTSMLYWRGPVFYDFDGQRWHLDAQVAKGQGRALMASGWRRGSDFLREFRSTTQEVAYRVRLTPHNALWLYALDVPSRLDAESFISADWQVLAHTPVQQEASYELVSALEWSAQQPVLEAAQRERALALPAHSNPRLQALGREWAQVWPREQLVPQALQALAQGGYQYRDRFAAPQGEHALDQFWFDTQEGNSEFLAASFVVLMRAAGVPARLVTGYRGGKLMALTDYVVVKRSHAHAWAEVWREGQGWSRVDPTDVLKPPQNAAQAPRPQAAPTPATIPRKPEADGAAPPPPSSDAGMASAQARARPAQQGSSWDWPDLAAMAGRWLLQLDARRQLDLLPAGLDGSAWIWLLVAALSAAALVMLLGTLWARWRTQRHVPAPQRAWERACRQLARRGWPMAAHECPSRYAQRVAAVQQGWAPALLQLAQAYAQWRYGRHPAAHAPQVAPAARLLINRLLSEPARPSAPTPH